MERKDKFIAELQNLKNLEKCPRYEHCSIPICPLDLNLPFRNNPERSKCRFFREQKRGIKGGEMITFGGQIAPDELLIYVPPYNAKLLNEVSQKRWQELKEKLQSK